MSRARLSFRGQWCSLYKDCIYKEAKCYQPGSAGTEATATRRKRHRSANEGERFAVIHSVDCSAQGLISFPLFLFALISNQTSNYGSTERLPFSCHVKSSAQGEALPTVNICQFICSPFPSQTSPSCPIYTQPLRQAKTQAIFEAALTFSWVWVRPPAPGWRTCASRAWRCRKCGCTRSRHCSQGPAAFEPTSPCRMGEGSPQIQRAGIQGVLAGEGCSGCCHEERSLRNKNKVHGYHLFLASVSTVITALVKHGVSLLDTTVSGRGFWSTQCSLGGEGSAFVHVAKELGWHHKHLWKAWFECFWNSTVIFLSTRVGKVQVGNNNHLLLLWEEGTLYKSSGKNTVIAGLTERKCEE